MRTDDFDYELPAEFIAQTPVEPRDASRLLVLDRQKDSLEQAIFHDLGRYLHAGDLLVINETRVIPARLYASRVQANGHSGGRRYEILLLRRIDGHTWEALVGGKKPNPGLKLQVEKGPEAEITAALEGPRRLVRFSEPVENSLPEAGHMPLPPYIHRRLDDPERYQTVYAHQPGSAAAPTAGLHFTPRLIESLQKQGIGFASVTLHVGLDTFQPVSEDDPETHQIHTEWCRITPEAAQKINSTHRNGGRIVAVGTTSVRTLESAARLAAPGDTVGPFEGSTGLFILPGFEFKAVDAMITNFHLPRSTLIMLVSAFAGRERVLAAYRFAQENRFRFYSFGDAMLIV